MKLDQLTPPATYQPACSVCNGTPAPWEADRLTQRYLTLGVIVRSNAATKIRSEQAGVLRWPGRGGDMSQTRAAGEPVALMTAECSGQHCQQ